MQADGGIFEDDAAPADSGPGDATRTDQDGAADLGPSDAGALDAARPDATEPTDAGGSTFAPFGILSLNLHCLRLDGTPYADNGSRFAAIAALVAAEDVAVILAQEVCQRPGESAQDLLLQALETATSTTWSVHWTYAHEAWTGTPDQAQEGLAIFAQGSLHNPRQVAYRRQGSLRRVLVAAELSPRLGGLTVHSVHLDHAAPLTRTAQSEETSTYATSLGPSLDLIIGGDLNDTTQSPVLTNLTRHGFEDAAATLGGIDHLLVHRGAGAQAGTARLVLDTPQTRVSDHPDVWVQIQPRPRPSVPVTRWSIPSNPGTYFTVRGDVAPLSWDQGLVAWPAPGGGWTLASSEIPAGPFEYKWLREDLAWQEGPNLSGQGGQDHQDQPTFP